MIKVLDCTLRDGGYINDWMFRGANIKKIISNLVSAKIDFIECGFFKPCEYNIDKSFFSTFEQLENFCLDLNDTKLTLMINFGEFPIEKIPCCKNQNIFLRIAFKKNQMNEAINYCQKLQEKGYKVFVNPMHTITYSSQELLNLIDLVNNLKPLAFTIVDTTGEMKEKDILSYFYLVDSNLDKNIPLAFHSHNNLQLSFSNAQCLLKVCKDRELIIDTTVFGMGRGAGNLCTELLTQYLNDNYNKDYDTIPILKIIDEQINPIFMKTPWGYSVPYYLASINSCHPNYAKYLVDKQTVTVEMINEFLKMIPTAKKSSYDANLIKQIYLDYLSHNVDDTSTLKFLKEKLENKKLLVMTPGKSISTQKKEIEDFISKENPFIVSLNFIPEDYKSDLVFVTNMKRFSTLNDKTIPIVVSSNIENIPPNALVINYSSYLNDSASFDNVALMFFYLLKKIGIKTLYLAGLDGYSMNFTENYVNEEIAFSVNQYDLKIKNEAMIEQIIKLKNDLDFHSITKSLYFSSIIKEQSLELV